MRAPAPWQGWTLWILRILALGPVACRGRGEEQLSATSTSVRSGPKPEPGAVWGSASVRVPSPRAAASANEGAATPEPVGGPWVTCYAHYRPSSTPERDVTRLGLLCGPANGMKVVGATLAGEVADGFVEHAFDVKQGECFRILAVASLEVPDLAVEVRDPQGVPVASDHGSDRWPILNPDGPFCLIDGGKYTVRVRARQGRGKYALQIWRLP
ncbi:MAG TPA: hypothetical protein VJT73_12575 [Polyangiaceae bacterium]|nr:hypothetical protein [Polyangiaceae bacterium]